MSLKKFSMHSGFTLVELLITIIVIGILAAVLMYSSNEVISTARATKILANLHIVKNAVLAFYSDNPDIFEDLSSGINNGIQNYLYHHKDKIPLITKYFDGQDIEFQKYTRVSDVNMPFATEGSYGVSDSGCEDTVNKTVGNSGIDTRYTWYVGYRFKANEGRVKEKLRAMKKSAGIDFYGRIPNVNEKANQNINGEIFNATKGDDVVWLKVFGQWKRDEE